MLASFPASMLNQNHPDLGILNRFKLNPSRSSTAFDLKFLKTDPLQPVQEFQIGGTRVETQLVVHQVIAAARQTADMKISARLS